MSLATPVFAAAQDNRLPEPHADRATLLHNLAEALISAGDAPAGIEACRNALRVAPATSQLEALHYSCTLAQALQQAACTCTSSATSSEARALLESAAEGLEAALGISHVRALRARGLLLALQVASGELGFGQLERLRGVVCALKTQVCTANHPWLRELERALAPHVMERPDDEGDTGSIASEVPAKPEWHVSVSFQVLPNLRTR